MVAIGNSALADTTGSAFSVGTNAVAGVQSGGGHLAVGNIAIAAGNPDTNAHFGTSAPTQVSVVGNLSETVAVGNGEVDVAGASPCGLCERSRRSRGAGRRSTSARCSVRW